MRSIRGYEVNEIDPLAYHRLETPGRTQRLARLCYVEVGEVMSARCNVEALQGGSGIALWRNVKSVAGIIWDTFSESTSKAAKKRNYSVTPYIWTCCGKVLLTLISCYVSLLLLVQTATPVPKMYSIILVVIHFTVLINKNDCQ